MTISSKASVTYSPESARRRSRKGRASTSLRPSLRSSTPSATLRLDLASWLSKLLEASSRVG